MTKRVFLLLCLSLVICTTAFGQKKTIKKIDAYIEQSRQLWNIPGVAVAIVQNGEIVLSKGYGVKSVDSMEPVDENTLFAIASNSKAFTTAAIAMLVDEGKMSWDDKVRDYLPYFEISDPYVSAEMTVRDLLCHRSGLATFSGDLIWYGSNYSREDIIRRAKYLEPVSGFRSEYGYQNIMFLAAGEIVAAVSGQSWDDFVKEHFFDPLNMSTAVTSIREFTPQTNLALPHNETNGKNHTIEWVNWDNIAPAGGICASVNELTNWMNLQLGYGTLDSTTFWSERQAHEMWAPQINKGIGSWSRQNFPSKTFSAYGLGWDLYNYHGRKIVNHGGGYDGMISKTVLIPEENIGFVILTNNNNWLSSALSNYMLDMLLTGATTKDWAAYYLELKQGQDAEDAAAKKKAEEERLKDTKPTLPLEAYAGTYGGPMYGNCIVRVIGDQLAFQFEPTPLFRGTFRHWQYDVFQLNWGTKMMLPSGTAQFIIGVDGTVEEMRIDVPNPDFDFTELKFMKFDQ
jgi:CubicO group peptidase (beta-lactamase class C family)